MLNVLLVAGAANFSTRDVWDGYRVAFAEAGVNVVPYSTFAFLRLLSVDAVCNDIIGTALDQTNRFDYVVFIDGLYFRGHRSRVPQSIRRGGIPTVLIATDDPYRNIPGSESLYTHRFTNEITSAHHGVEYLPTATLPPPKRAPVESPTYDVSFLGTVFEDRVDALMQVAEFCESEKLRFLIAGKLLEKPDRFDHFQFTDVRLKTVDEDQKWQIYADSKTTINIFRESETSAESPNPRIFEATAFGAAAVVSGPPRKEVNRLFGDCLYCYGDDATIVDAVRHSLADHLERRRRIDTAQSITLASHTYHHRAVDVIRSITSKPSDDNDTNFLETQTTWIIGCGRTGSTWLAELLGDLPQIRRWHEPYYGRFFKHLQDRPDEMARSSSFFADRQQVVWLRGLNRLLMDVARDRFPQWGKHSLVVKEVNTPEFYNWIGAVFPHSKMILLVRDPFDVLDSYLDLQRPGSWNERFKEDQHDRLDEVNVRRSANHIAQSMNASIEAYERFPQRQRLRISYEDLLSTPAETLRLCCQLIGRQPSDDDLTEVSERHRFENYKQTGPLAFRRQGRSGGWVRSPNFTGEVHQIAGSILGDLRTRLGYQSRPIREESDIAILKQD